MGRRSSTSLSGRGTPWGDGTVYPRGQTIQSRCTSYTSSRDHPPGQHSKHMLERPSRCLSTCFVSRVGRSVSSEFVSRVETVRISIHWRCPSPHRIVSSHAPKSTSVASADVLPASVVSVCPQRGPGGYPSNGNGLGLATSRAPPWLSAMARARFHRPPNVRSQQTCAAARVGACRTRAPVANCRSTRTATAAHHRDLDEDERKIAIAIEIFPKISNEGRVPGRTSTCRKGGWTVGSSEGVSRGRSMPIGRWTFRLVRRPPGGSTAGRAASIQPHRIGRCRMDGRGAG